MAVTTDVKVKFQDRKTETISLFAPKKRGCIFRLSVVICVQSGSGAHFGILGSATPGDTPIYDNEGFPNLRQFRAPVAWKRVIVGRVIVHPNGHVTYDFSALHRPRRRGPSDLCPDLRNAWPRPRGGNQFSVGVPGGDVMYWTAVPTASVHETNRMLRVKIDVSGFPMFVLDQGVLYADPTWITSIDITVRAKLVPVALL